MHEQKLTAEMRECISSCLDCHATCLETAAHCLTFGGAHASAHHQTVLQDCAEICQTSANFMLRTSERHTEICGVCSKICRACADECRSIAGTDNLMKRCADLCQTCAESCDRMAHMFA
jgi:hypothetical protein